MNQLYAEAGVKKADTLTTMLLRSLLIIGMIAGLLVMLKGGVLGIIGVALVVALGFLFPKLNVEYEYVFVDGQLDFDKITGKSKRKTLLQIDLEQVEVMAPAGSHALDSYTYIQCEKKDFSSGRKDSRPYIIMAGIENKKMQIVFEPNEKMLSMIKQKSPRKLTDC